MDSDALRSARVRYESAYNEYLALARSIKKKLDGGIAATAEDLRAEHDARERLAIARRTLIDAINDVLRR